jgi:hypothetical protein
MGIDDVVTDLVDDQLDLSSDLEVFEGFFGGDVGRQGVLLGPGNSGRVPALGWC